MADDSDLERSEPASARRREQAREDGQVVHSRELGTLALLLAAWGALSTLGHGLAQHLSQLLKSSMNLSREMVFDPHALGQRLTDFTLETLLAVLPVLVVLVIAGLASSVALHGFNFSWKPLMPDFARMNPLKGLGRMVSSHGALEMLKALAKSLLVGAVAFWVVQRQASAMLGLVSEPLTGGMAHMMELVSFATLVMVGSLALVVLIDVPFQLWFHEKNLRMTKEEMRQEHKETEGNPQIKQQIRAQQREMAQRRMMAAIPTADVVVTNPTHYAVALRYDDSRMRAPRVVAKGTELVAARIRALAAEHQVPLLEMPPLARALHRHAEIGDEVPAPLYTAVAEVLAYVYQLRRHRAGAAARPEPPRPGPLPAGMDPADKPLPEAVPA